jgi:hypothetical protein
VTEIFRAVVFIVFLACALLFARQVLEDYEKRVQANASVIDSVLAPRHRPKMDAH